MSQWKPSVKKHPACSEQEIPANSWSGQAEFPGINVTSLLSLHVGSMGIYWSRSWADCRGHCARSGTAMGQHTWRREILQGEASHRPWQGELWSCCVSLTQHGYLHLTRAVISWHSKRDRCPKNVTIHTWMALVVQWNRLLARALKTNVTSAAGRQIAGFSGNHHPV